MKIVGILLCTGITFKLIYIFFVLYVSDEVVEMSK